MKAEQGGGAVCWPVLGRVTRRRADQPVELGEDSAALLLVVFSGEGTVQCGESREEYRAGRALLAGRGPVVLLPRTPTELGVLPILGAAGLLEALGEGRPLWAVDCDEPLQRRMLALLLDAQSGRPPNRYTSSAALFSLLMALGERAADPLSDHPPLVRRAAEAIRRDYARLSGVEELSERLAVSKSHLIRCFTAAMGRSPGEYLREVRVEQAKRLLEHRGDSIDTVASMVGYAGANYFCRVFRRVVGESPARYRSRRQSRRPLGEEALRQLDEFYVL